MNLQRGQRLRLADLIEVRSLFTIEAVVDAPRLMIDFSCFGLDADSKLVDNRYMIFSNRPTTPCGAVLFEYPAKNTSVFNIDLQKLPVSVEKLVIAAAIDGYGTMSQINRGMLALSQRNVKNAVFTFVGSDFSAEKAVMLMEIYRKDSHWRICAQGQGFNSGLDILIHYFGGTVTEPINSTTTLLNPNTMMHSYKNPDEAGCFWKSSGITLSLANTAIDGGLLYFGSGLTSVGGLQPEPALIDPKLPIGNIASADYQQRVSYYWSSYSGASPDTRAAYIKWLVNGRCDPLAEIGYVLLYFFGLERRALADAKTDATAKAELPKIIQEVERLLAIYHGNGLFRNWATGLLDVLKLDCEETFVPKQYLRSLS